MKRTIRIISAAIGIFVAIGVLQAAPPGKGSVVGVHKSGTVAQIKALKPGDQYAVFCTMCKTLTIKEVGEKESAADLCKEEGTLKCAGCGKESKIKHKGPPGKRHPVFVNEKGEECMFMVPLKPKE